MSTFLGVCMRNTRDNVFKFLNEEGATYTLHITPPFYILFISTYYMLKVRLSPSKKIVFFALMKAY